MQTTYGIQIQERDDPYVRTVEKAMEGIESLIAAAYIVDFIPIRKFILPLLLL